MRTIPPPHLYKRNIITLFLLLFASTVIAKPNQSDGLVLRFRAGPSAVKIKDTSGQKNNGTPVFVVVTNSPSLVSMQDTHQLTLALWIKPRSIGGGFPVLISKGGNQQPGAFGGYELVLNAVGDNDIVFASGDYLADTTGANGSLVNNHLGEWIHIVFTMDTVAQTAQFYVNGQLYANTTSSGDITGVNFDLPNNLYVGEPDPGANGNRVPFDGDMKQINIFNRTLSADEVQKLFSTTHPRP
jgi:hypothetical protein